MDDAERLFKERRKEKYKRFHEMVKKICGRRMVKGKYRISVGMR